MSIVFSRWTDDDLLCVLAHANGDFAVALDTILHHETTGRPPEDLIHYLLSARERQYFQGSSSPRSRNPRRSYSESENIQRQRQHQSIPNDSNGVDLGGCGSDPVGLDRKRRGGSYDVGTVSSAPPRSSAPLPLLEGEGIPFNIERRQQQQDLPLPATIDKFSSGVGLNSNSTWDIPAASPSSRSADTMNHSTPLTQHRIDMNRTLSESRQTHTDEETEAKAEASESTSTHQLMLNMQSGIEASLKKTKNTSETDTDINNEVMVMSYAAKVSKETFDEEYRKQEARKALEKRMVDISLAVSLSDPVKKSEEELIGEALKKSLADPIPKSEVQLFEQARENSLEDIERLEVIMKSEEELVEVAKQKSLHILSKDEELIDAVKRQSLKDALKDPLSRALEESLSESLEFDTRRRLTSSTHLLSFGEDGNSDCSSCVEHHLMPSRFDSPLKRSDFDLTDRKMPALDLPTAQNCEEDQAQHSNRLRSTSDCSSSVDLLDRKMPAVVLPASQNGDVISSLTFSHHSDCLSSSDHFREYDNRSAAGRSVDQHSKDSRNSKVRCLSVDGASLSLINGVYKEEVNKSNMFTLRVGLNDGIGTVASIYQTTSTQGKKEWVISLFNSNFPPDTELGTDVILYTASVDNFNEELPSPSTNWVSRNAMVLTGSPPRVAEL